MVENRYPHRDYRWWLVGAAQPQPPSRRRVRYMSTFSPTPFSTAPYRPSLLFRVSSPLPKSSYALAQRILLVGVGTAYAPSSRFSRPFCSTRVPTLSLSQFSISRPLHPPSQATRILFAYYPFVPRNAEKPREAPGSAGKRREAPGNDAPRHTPSLTLVYPSLSTHCSHSFPFAPACFLPLLLVRYSLVSHTTRIEAVYIVLRSVSKLRENDRFVVEQRVVWLVSFSLFSIRILSFPNLFLERIL